MRDDAYMYQIFKCTILLVVFFVTMDAMYDCNDGSKIQVSYS
jgi:hypothetical protein